ncbi:MAG: hypothetical protein LAT81_15785 [Oceanicaulis sp.]|nr:hypothetical protein [Oceanicaulis sp.]
MVLSTHRLDIVSHRTSGWFVATAENLPGFFVQGATVDQLLERAPLVLERYLRGRNIEAHDIRVAPEGEPASGLAQTRAVACFQTPETLAAP